MLNSMFVIIGTVIGAGFASGKEIFTFFNIYGGFGLIGLVLACLLIGFVIYKSFCIIINNNITTYHEFVSSVFCKSNFLSLVMCNIINIFLLISFVVMVAGFSAYFAQEFNMPNVFGAIIIAALSFVTFLNSINGIVKINFYLIPCLIVIIAILGFKNLDAFTFIEYNSNGSSLGWITKALLYSSYNLIILLPILITLKKYVFTSSKAKYVAFFSVLFLALMAVILFFLLNHNFYEVQSIELPTIFIAGKLGSIYRYSCGFAILAAIFTTAISSGYGFLSNLNIKNSKNYILATLSICIFSVLLSNIGFSALLNSLYPILGLLRFYSNFIYSV